MKKKIGQKTETVDIFEEVCDICDRTLEDTTGCKINFQFGYDSRRYDADYGTVELCNACAEHLLEEYFWKMAPNRLFLQGNHFHGRVTGEQFEKERRLLGYPEKLTDEQKDLIRDRLGIPSRMKLEDFDD